MGRKGDRLVGRQTDWHRDRQADGQIGDRQACRQAVRQARNWATHANG